MKTFVKFISECYFFLTEAKKEGGRGGPDYDYEQSFVNLYNHMASDSSKKGAEMRKQFRLAVSKGDMFTVVDLISREIQRAQTDPSSPLYFDNLDPTDPGFTGGKRSKTGEVEDKEAHRQAYYDKLMNQQYSLLNFVQSESGRGQVINRAVAQREGATKVPLTAKGKELTGKEQDTSKVDVSFTGKDGNTYGISLKDAKGAVVNSSGSEETKAYILLGMDSLLNQQEQSGEITPEQRAEKEAMGTELANQLALYMASTRGMSKEQQKDALGQMQEYLSSIESVVPGTMQAMSAEAITGKGKYGDASTVDALFSTGRGGEVIEDPSWLAQYVFQRGRLGKGQTKPKEGPRVQRPTTIAGDIKNYRDAENKPEDSEYLRKWRDEWGQSAWEKKIGGFEPEIQDEIRKLQGTGQFSLRDLYNYEQQDTQVKQLKSFDQFQQDAQSSEKDLISKQKQYDATAAEVEKASVPIDPETGKEVLHQRRPNLKAFMASNPTSKVAQVNNERQQQAQAKLTQAQSELDNASAIHQSNQSNLDTVASSIQAQQQAAAEKEQQPTQTPTTNNQQQQQQTTQLPPQETPQPEQPKKPTQQTQQVAQSQPATPEPTQQQQQPIATTQQPTPTPTEKPTPTPTEKPIQEPQKKKRNGKEQIQPETTQTQPQ